MYSCEMCKKQFTSLRSLQRHSKESCKGKQPPTKRRKIEGSGPSESGEPPASVPSPETPSTSGQPSSRNVSLESGVRLLKGAFNKRIATYLISDREEHVDFDNFFKSIKKKVIDLIEEVWKTNGTMKVNMILSGKYIKVSDEYKEPAESKSFHTTNTVISHSTDLRKCFDEFVEKMLNKSSEFEEQDSGVIF